MAHFAELDDNQVVLRVIVVDNDNEADGETWCKNLLGGIAWKQTSYNKKFRKNYAGIGFTYDESRNAFIPPKPFPSWLLVEDTCQWKPPVDYPGSETITWPDRYEWDEDRKRWELIRT